MYLYLDTEFRYNKHVIKHGTHCGYNVQKCRCSVCTEFRSKYYKDLRRKVNPHLKPRGKHNRPTKVCSGCGILRNQDNTNRRGKSLYALCKTCQSKKGKNYYKKNSEKIIKKTTEDARKRGGRNYDYKKYQAKNFLVESKRRDLARGMENNLTLVFVESLLSKSCYACGSSTMRMTLDRIDNKIGHTETNVLSCCRRCNYLRRDMPFDAWKLFFPVLEKIREINAFGDWSPGPKIHRIFK